MAGERILRWRSYADRLLADDDFTLQAMLPDCLPSAEQIVRLAVDDLRAGNTVSAAEAMPVYLRNDVARKPKTMTF